MILVTGASGHIGSNLVRTLLEDQREVRTMVRKDQRSIAGLHVEAMAGDICAPETLGPLLEGIDVVYHCAAHIAVGTDGGQCQRVNVEGTRNLLDACLRAGTRRFIYFSSIHAMSPEPVDQELDETRALVVPPNASPYSCSKATAEALVMESTSQGLETVVLAPTGVLGPHDYKPSRMGRVLQEMANRRFRVLIDGGFDWVDARDVSLAAMAAETRAPSGSKYLVSGGWASIRDLAAAVEACWGAAPPRWTLPTWFAHLAVPFAAVAGWVTRTEPSVSTASLQILTHQARVVSQERARNDLGHRPRPLVETVADSLDWALRAGMLETGFKHA